MKIGLAIIAYNRKLFTEQCIKSVLWSEPKDVSIVIVDNNSTDGTQEMLAEYHKANAIIKEVIYNTENKYTGYAINQGGTILSEYCDVVGSMGNDLLAEPGWDQNMLACLQELNLDYIVGVVKPDREKIKKITPSGNGHYTPREPSGAIFLRTKHFLNGFRYSEMPLHKGYMGPMLGFNKKLESLKGVRLARPGIVRRKCEYTNPDYIEYYNQTFGERGITEELARRRKLESGGKWDLASPNWEEFVSKYYHGRH